jgi:glucoamylase
MSSAIGLASPTIGHGIKKRADIDSFITTEGSIAYKGTLANIGPNGTGAPGASAGIVVASPSKTDPDCKFTPISSDT